MHKKKVFSIVALVLIIAGLLIFFHGTREIKSVVVGGKTFSVEVARTDMERERGLSLHVPLQNNQGMLFIFQKEDLYGFWMKDMLFPIDIVWIDQNLRIIHIERAIVPETYPKIFKAGAKSLYVLEIPAGQSDIIKIKTGDTVKFIKN